MASAEPICQTAEILVAPTWKCNLRCTYCFVRNNNLVNDEVSMSSEVATRIIDALDLGLTNVENICIHFYGGEPFTNISAIETMVKRAREKRRGRFSFAVTTNGTILSKDILHLLRSGSFSIVLSIDGPAEVHDECRRSVHGTRTHAKVLQFLETVRAETSCRICASSVVRSGWSLKQATEYARTLPINSIKAQAIRVHNNSPHALNNQEYKDYLVHLEEIGCKVINDLENSRLPVDNRFASRVLQLLNGEKRRRFCAAGYTTFGITPSGNVLPCILIENNGAVLGHISDNPKKWIGAGQNWRAKPLRTVCHTCAFLHMCGGGCPAIIPVCGEDECGIIRKNCEIAISIYEHFRDKPEALLGLAGIT